MENKYRFFLQAFPATLNAKFLLTWHILNLLDLLYKYHAPKSVRSIRMPKKNPMVMVNIPNPFCQHRTQARLPAAPHRGPLGSCVKPDLSDWESQTDSEHSPQGCFIGTVRSFSSFF